MERKLYGTELIVSASRQQSLIIHYIYKAPVQRELTSGQLKNKAKSKQKHKQDANQIHIRQSKDIASK